MKNKQYRAPKQNIPPTIKYLGTCLDGKCLMTMIVCLSPAGQNGWETWFSLQYGTDLSALSAPTKPVKPRSVAKVLTETRLEFKKTKEDLAKTPKSGSPASKYYHSRVFKCLHFEGYLKLLEELGDGAK